MSEPAPGLLPFGGEEAVSPYAQARIAVLPVPYEGTVSYGAGTSEGPSAILRASTQVELYDERTRTEPYRAGIWTEPPLDIPEGTGEDVAAAVEHAIERLLRDGKWPLMLGGEHSITPGAVRAAAKRHPGLVVVQLDAHADLRDSYLGDRWSHASAMARCLEHAPVRAIGIRSYSVQEAQRISAGIHGYAIVHAWEMKDAGCGKALDGLEGRPVYLTFDVDYLDPSVVPATGTPEPGGGLWWPTLALLEDLFARARVVGCDLVELAPSPGLHHAEFAVARLAYALMGMAARTVLRA